MEKHNIKKDIANIEQIPNILEQLPYIENSKCNCNNKYCMHCHPEEYGIQRKENELLTELEEFVLTQTITGAVRNGLEDHHSGIFPSSKTGDFSDVKVVTPYGEIPWNNLSRISDNEMGPLKDEIRKEVKIALRMFLSNKEILIKMLIDEIIK